MRRVIQFFPYTNVYWNVHMIVPPPLADALMYVKIALLVVPTSALIYALLNVIAVGLGLHVTTPAACWAVVKLLPLAIGSVILAL